ncbi:hypothetical protein SAMN05660226_00991 [Parapedobacter luteus]|uniref:Uncharacterized protein n=1 Tax=Parapedobacter luteus TaxID=623280 RepID=A0A1T5AR65_9SPHI|nr:hypothetical protein SAMN05660226_00991 [Parapedobacter luteus]
MCIDDILYDWFNPPIIFCSVNLPKGTTFAWQNLNSTLRLNVLQSAKITLIL